MVSRDANESHPGSLLYGSKLFLDSTFRGLDTFGPAIDISRVVRRRISGSVWWRAQLSRLRLRIALTSRQMTQMTATQIALAAIAMPAMASFLRPCDDSSLAPMFRGTTDFKTVMMDTSDCFVRKMRSLIAERLWEGNAASVDRLQWRKRNR